MSAPVASVALIDGIDVDAVAAAVTACPGVSGLFGGRGDAIASYLPGRRVAGVEVHPDVLTVHVRSRWGIPAAALLTQIARAVFPLLQGHHLEVVVADIDDADPPASPAKADPPASPVKADPPASPVKADLPAALSRTDLPATPATTAPPATTTNSPAANATPATVEPVVDPTAKVGPPGALPRSTVRAPGSSPAPTKPSPKPAPPTFPTA